MSNWYYYDNDGQKHRRQEFLPFVLINYAIGIVLLLMTGFHWESEWDDTMTR